MKFKRVKKRSTTRRRDPSEDQWGSASPRRIEEHLIEASERIVKADSAMAAVLPKVRRPGERGQRSRVKQNIGYLHRLLTEALKHIDAANQEVGF